MLFDPQLLLPALDEAADFIVVTDNTPPERNGPLVAYANRSFLEATGFSKEELIGSSYLTFFSPRNAPRVNESIIHAFEARESNYKEMLALRKDGSDFWLEFVSRPFHRVNGREYRLAIGRDISMRRRALSQMALLFAAVESAADAVTLYEPAVAGTLELTYENERSFKSGNGRLLSIWSDESNQSKQIRKNLETDGSAQEYFAELDSSGLPKLVQFSAHAVRSDSRIEGIVTVERILASAHDAGADGYKSLLLRIAVVLPSLAHATSHLERFALLRAILVDAFDAELYESEETPPPASLNVAAERQTARFPLGGKSMLVRWQRPLASTALTALRFCIEAAMEQERLPGSR